AERRQCCRPRGSDSGRLPREGPVLDSGSRAAELGASGGVRRAAFSAESGNAGELPSESVKPRALICAAGYLPTARIFDVSSETFVGACGSEMVNGAGELDVRTHFTSRVRPH